MTFCRCELQCIQKFQRFWCRRRPQLILDRRFLQYAHAQSWLLCSNTSCDSIRNRYTGRLYEPMVVHPGWKALTETIDIIMTRVLAIYYYGKLTCSQLIAPAYINIGYLREEAYDTLKGITLRRGSVGPFRSHISFIVRWRCENFVIVWLQISSDYNSVKVLPLALAEATRSVSSFHRLSCW